MQLLYVKMLTARKPSFRLLFDSILRNLKVLFLKPTGNARSDLGISPPFV
jgi:hypothetical protein